MPRYALKIEYDGRPFAGWQWQEALPSVQAALEAALTAHPGVAEAAAVEQAVRPGVSIIAAFYVPAGGPVPEADLAAHCAGLLARYKCPRAFYPVEALPRTAYGKLQRRRLRQALSEGQSETPANGSAG